MFLGVMFYSFVVGSLTTVMTSENKAQEVLSKQLDALDEINQKIVLDEEVYNNIKKFLLNNNSEVV